MAAQTESQIFKEVCENDFSFFVKHYLKVIEPETEFKWNWHMDTLCHYCERVYYGDYQNLDINIPPRMMKSLIITVLFPCWIWTKDPSKKIATASRSYDLSLQFNNKRKRIVESEEFQAYWPTILTKSSEGHFENTRNGVMRAVSALGKIVGAGFDLLLSDDLLDTMDAFSNAKRTNVNRWFSNAWYNRAQSKHGVRRINVNQRLHEKDVSGHIRENHNFDTLIIPMVKMDYNQSTVDFIDPREVGEFIFPTRYGQKEMDDDFKGLGNYGWSSQYQQSPKPIGGGIIKKEWLRFYSSPPRCSKRIITADLSFKGNRNSDFVCFQYWGTDGPNKYLLDIVRGRWSYGETKERFIDFCNKNDASIKYIEDKANGPALISDLSYSIKGLRGWPEKGSKYYNADKVQRLHMVSQNFEMGEVYLPENMEIIEAYIDELISFTEKGSTTGNDDMVDTTSMALLELKKSQAFFLG